MTTFLIFCLTTAPKHFETGEDPCTIQQQQRTVTSFCRAYGQSSKQNRDRIDIDCLQLSTQANRKAEMSPSEKPQHKQKKSLGNNLLVSSKYRTMVFFLLFLALKYAWKTKGRTTKGLKDSDLIAQTKKKHSAQERGGNQVGV